MRLQEDYGIGPPMRIVLRDGPARISALEEAHKQVKQAVGCADDAAVTAALKAATGNIDEVSYGLYQFRILSAAASCTADHYHFQQSQQCTALALLHAMLSVVSMRTRSAHHTAMLQRQQTLPRPLAPCCHR